MKAENEVLYNAISFFLKNTDHCYLTKLLKLIYLFDLEHIRAVGFSATGKKYHAWDLGPVTKELYYSVHGDTDNGFEDFFQSFEVQKIEYSEGRFKYLLEPKFNLDEDVFSLFQLDLIRKIASTYKADLSQALIDVTHRKNDPWHIVYEIRGAKDEVIPMELVFNSLDESTKKMLEARFSEL